jgi:hypothetical protein
MKNRINANGDYLLLAPKSKEGGGGYYHQISERGYLVSNIKNFMINFGIQDEKIITIYELKEINQEQSK